MGEILLPACRFPRLSDGATCRDIYAETLCQACTAHVQVAALRTRLESTEAESRQAFEDHQEVCAVIINLRALLRELAAAVRELDGRKYHTLGWSYARNVMLGVLRRAEAEAGDAK